MYNRIPDPYITVTRDERGAARHLEHWQRRAPYSPWIEKALHPSEAPSARDMADEYLRKRSRERLLIRIRGRGRSRQRI